ncbi:hypothetical protein D3C81_1774070 [compost metagenome]
MDELEAHAGDGRHPAVDRFDGEQHQQKIPQAKQEDPGIDGQRHARRVRDHSRLSRRAQFWRRAVRKGSLSRCQPEQHRQAVDDDQDRRRLHADAAAGDLQRHGGGHVPRPVPSRRCIAG